MVVQVINLYKLGDTAAMGTWAEECLDKEAQPSSHQQPSVSEKNKVSSREIDPATTLSRLSIDRQCSAALMQACGCALYAKILSLSDWSSLLPASAGQRDVISNRFSR